METLADLVARDRRSDHPALLAAGREMDYRRFCTTAWKASNYLRHLGVGGDRGVVTLANRSPPPLLTFFGAALLDVPTRFVDAVDDIPAAIAETDARAVLVPAEVQVRVEPPAGTTLVVYDGEAETPTTDHWETGVWSENPAFVPSSATPSSTALLTATGSVSHGELLAAAKDFTESSSLDADDTVAVESSLADPRTIAAGVVAPLLVGGTVQLGPGARTVTVDTDRLDDVQL